MAIPSSQNIRSVNQMVPDLRPVMPVDLFRAALEGNNDVLVPRLGLQPEERTEIQVTIEASHSAPEQTKHQAVQSELRSATRFGETVLHLLVTKRHNELALKVFQRDMSLLKAQNKMLETPLHCAAKVGNETVIHNLIQIDPVVVRDVLEETNKNGDTALHIAAKHGHINVGQELMKFDPEMAYKDNNEMLSPLYIAIVKGYTKMVHTMLDDDPTLACTQFSNGMFPVHVSAHMGSKELVMLFMEKYPDDAELLDPCGRNLFHIAAEENRNKFYLHVLKGSSVGEMIARMNNAMDYEGNTPLHIAATKGHESVMRAICENKMNHIAETIRNNEGYTPLELSARQHLEANECINDEGRVRRYVKNEGYKFTRKWFDYIMGPSNKDRWEKTQVIGLGSVLITTVTFAAAFTMPGGYNQDHGTPVLGRRYMFRAFILANSLAFIQGILSLFALLGNAMEGPTRSNLLHATNAFLLAASSMVVAFGLGLYVILSPVCFPIAILLLVITLFFGSPGVLLVFAMLERYYTIDDLSTGLTSYVLCFLFIFCLAFM